MNTVAGDYLVYLAGIEVPVLAVSVTTSSAGLPVISLSLVPDPLVQDLGKGDKVRVTVFYLDTHYNSTRNLLPSYRLLVEGEIAGRNISSGPDRKSLELSCGDLASTLLHIRPSMITDLNSFAEDETGVGAVSTFFGTPFAQNAVMLNSGVGGSTRGLIRRPYDLVKNILSSMGDVSAPPQNKSVLMRLFYQQWNARTKFSDRFVPSFGIESLSPENDIPFPVMRAATSDQLVQVLRGMTESLGDQANLWQYMQSILQSFFYSITPVLAPSIAYTNDSDEVNNAVENYGPPELGVAAPGSRMRLCSYITHPDLSFGIPPACNVVWPCMVLQHSFSEDYMSAPTRTYLGDANLLNMMGQQDGALRNVAQLAMTVGYPSRAQEILQAGKDGAPVNYNDFLIFPEEYYRGPNIQSVGIPPVFFYLSRAGGVENLRDGVMPRYAEMVHHRSVAATRSGQVVMPFNPYVVMNFPIVILDPNGGNNHMYAKVTGITHNLSPQSKQTIVQYSMGRLLSDVAFEYMKKYIEDPSTTRDMSPVEPVTELADQFQMITPAAAYYSAMFYGFSTIDDPSKFAFDFKKVMAWTTDPSLADVRELAQDLYPEIVNNTRVVEFILNDTYSKLGGDYTLAMRAVSRPVCRLQDYVAFMAPYGVEDGVESDRTTSTIRHVAPFPRKLLSYVQGPPEAPSTSPSGDPCTPATSDTRLDWESRLLQYRQRVYKHLYNTR